MASSKILDFVERERRSLSSALDDSQNWLDSFTAGIGGMEKLVKPNTNDQGQRGEMGAESSFQRYQHQSQGEVMDVFDQYNPRAYGPPSPTPAPAGFQGSTVEPPTYQDIDQAKMRLKGSIESFKEKVDDLKEAAELEGESFGFEGGGGGRRDRYFEQQQQQQDSYEQPYSERGQLPHSLNTATYAAQYGGGHDSPKSRSSVANQNKEMIEKRVKGEMKSLMGKVKKEVNLERSVVQDKMKRFAIRETEQKLNEMRRGHVEELEKVLGETLMSVGGSLVSHDQKQIMQLRAALESKRDEMLVEQRDSIYAKLEIAVRSLEREHHHKIKMLKEDAELSARNEMQKRLEAREREYKLEMAEGELRESIEIKIEDVSRENANETERVFGELAVALETGAKKNINQLKERLKESLEEKKNNLITHGERVVWEAMESLRTEIRESERQELNEIKIRMEQERVDRMNKTRTEGTQALDRAVEQEKGRIRKRRDLHVHELREELQRKTTIDLNELQEALQKDLETAENLMIDSVKGGLASTLQHAADEHSGRVVVDEKMIDDLTDKLRAKQMEVVKELPGFINRYRLRAVGEAGRRSGSAEFEVKRTVIEEIEGNMSAGKTALALNLLNDKYVLLEKRNDEASKLLASITSETHSLKKELKSVDEAIYSKFYNKGEWQTGAKLLDDSTLVNKRDAIDNILDNAFKALATNGGLGEFTGGDQEGEAVKKGACRKCKKLYKVNGELLREINMYQGTDKGEWE